MDQKRAALIELAKRTKREQWRRNPMLWVKERLGEDPKFFEWSEFSKLYDNHEWDGDKNPLAQSWKVLSEAYIDSSEGRDPIARIVGLMAATGAGKTYLLARIVYWFLDCFEDSLVLTTAPTKEQLKSGMWSELSNFMGKIKSQHPNANLYTMRLLMDDKSNLKRSTQANLDFSDSYDGWMAMSHITGSGADEMSAVKARGFHRKYMLIILEECSGMAWSVVNAFQNTCTGSYNYIFAVGNPSSKTDALNLLISQKNAKGFRVSAYDHPNIVLQKEVIEGAVTQVSINDRKNTYGEGSRLYDAMVRGISPEQSYNSLIRAEWFEEAINRELHTFDKSSAIGVDVAASENGDKGACAYGVGPKLMELHEFVCPNATHLANNLLIEPENRMDKGIPDYHIPSIHKYKSEDKFIGIDGTGVGVATVEAFVNKGYRVTSLQGGQWEETIKPDPFTKEPMWRFTGLRSQMYYELREDMRKGDISFVGIPTETLMALRRELLAVNFENNQRMIAIEGKENIKKKIGGKSPNLADAVVYWNWVRKGYRISKKVAVGIAASKK